MKILFAFIFIGLGWSTFSQLNVDSLSHISYQQLHGANLTDVWGYEDEMGNEYAIVGTSKGTSIVDISNPSNPVEIFWMPGTESIWRDPCVYGDYAYVTTEADDGLLIIDLSPLPQSTNLPTSVYMGPPGQTWTSAHTCFCDNQGFAYVFGSNRGEGGVIILDITSNPMQPIEVGAFDNWYCHDGYVRNDTMYLAHIYDGFFSLVDVSNHAVPQLIATQPTPNLFSHNIWPSTSGQYVFTTDEVSGAYIAVYDIANPNAIVEVERIQNSPGAGVIPHNTHVMGDYLITSYYSDGIVIHDCTNPNNLVKVGQYDTYNGQTPGFDGCWGVYPFFTSGTIIAADITEGLFILGPTYEKGSYLKGNVTETGSGVPLNDVKVTLSNNNQPDYTNLQGAYVTGYYQVGTAQVLFEKVGYYPLTTNVTLIQGQEITLDAQLTPIPPFNIQVNVTDGATGTPIFDAQIKLVHPLITHTGVTNALGEEQLVLFYQEQYQIYVGKWGYKTFCTSQVIDQNTQVLNVTLTPGYYDDFELDFAWSVNGTAQTGIWERGTPNATSSGSVVVGDVPWDCGTSCFVTGNDPNVHPDFDDVDQGNTVLVSPPMDLTSLTNPHVNFARGYYNYYGPQAVDDTLKVYISNGSQLVLIDAVSPPQGNAMTWEYKSIGLNGLIPVTSTMQLVVSIADYDPNVNITEAAFDEFYVTNNSVNSLVETTSSLHIFPNPSHDFVTLTGISTNEPYVIMDNFGRIVAQGQAETVELKLDVQHWHAGFYVVQQAGKLLKFIKE